jgi:replication factor A1
VSTKVSRRILAGSGSGGAATFNRAEIRTIEDIKENLQIAEKAEMFSCRGTVLHIKAIIQPTPHALTKHARRRSLKLGKVGTAKSAKKFGKNLNTGTSSVVWIPEPLLTAYTRYIISMAVSDHTGQAWLQGFHDVGLIVFNMSADDLMEIKVCSLVNPMADVC